MLKEGRHQCKVTAPTNGWFGEAGENNTPFIRIPLVVTEGECEGEEVTYQAWITENALERTIKNLAEVFAWDGDLERLSKHMNTGPFVDKACSIVCEEEEYKGKKTVKIKWLNAPGEGSGKTMAQDAAAALAKRLQLRAQAAARTADYQPQPSSRPTPPPRPPADPDLDVQGEDIPFAFIPFLFLPELAQWLPW